MTTDHLQGAAGAAPETLEALMGQALAMELEAAQRYTELADTMEQHNNVEVATLFRKMATVEGKHASQIMAEMGWHEAPVSAWGLAWQGSEAAETIHHDELHYLMQPWHALKLALAAEQRAESFFAHLAASAVAEPVRAAARELLEEEREHVALIQAWLSKVPEPDHNWEDDPDPPRIDD